MDSLKTYSKLPKDSIKLSLDNYKIKDYIFYPRQSGFQNKSKITSSKSALNIFDIKENYNSFINNRKLNSNETVFNNKNFAPIYFYRKVQNPYKYNVTSIPEYLVKANQEKNFIDKLELHLRNDQNKKIFKQFLNNKKSSIIKDIYKPNGLDAQNILRYKPNFYSSNSNSFEKEENFNDKEIKTDINNNINKKYEPEQEISKEVQQTDIYNKKSKKQGDKYILKNRNKRMSLPNKSKSEWTPNKEFGTKMNFFSSVSYNILSPMYKGFNNRFITPTELNKNNLYNESPAFHKVKSISEYIDLLKRNS